MPEMTKKSRKRMRKNRSNRANLVTPKKPCLRCRSLSPRPENMRLCDNCKDHEIFGSVFAAY
jgi:hypothetical protein